MIVSLSNASTVLTDDQVKAFVPMLQTQVSRDLFMHWPGAEADLNFLPKDAMAPEAALVILDDTDQADALGYHDLTANGQPFGKVFAKTGADNGEDWHVTASHELCELLVDPRIDQLTKADYNGSLVTTIEEVCDPVEGNQYQIDGVYVSDFVLPSYYESDGVAPFDFLSVLKAPMTLAPGGYLSIQDAAGNWSQVFGQRVTTWRAKPPLGSRRERLRAGPSRWRRSTAI